MPDQTEVNLGCVIYTESIEGITAEWIFNRNNTIERGTGIGIRITEVNKNSRFEGEFEITYADENGNQSPQLRLTIVSESGYYNLTWKIGDQITDIGIGVEQDNKLFVSYKKVT